MGFIFATIISTLAGAIGWWLGEFFGFTAALMLSTIASVMGYYYGVKWNREYFG
ncbi:MAG: hypothetical protein KA250_17540 [Verrucomicrobiales bacterium]|jgi:hypothetical protein|nr:hypothetical protein [Verrucomicrobiales bacterium]MBP9225122.1 hypothetical protein [Verrucomicrobiales bacterium]HQZ28520.1 hypothetical protein [Verrucomicrobiales bacterium]